MLPAICDLCPADAADGYDDGETCLCEACCDRLLAGIKSNVEVAAGPDDEFDAFVADAIALTSAGPEDDDEDDDESTPLERDVWPTHELGGEGG